MSSFSWKDSSTNAVVPRISYPIKNNDINNLVIPSYKKPGPIKHYRKQLFPVKYSNSNRTNIYLLNTPGGFINTNKKLCSNNHVIKNNISHISPCNTCSNTFTFTTTSSNSKFNQNQYNSYNEYLKSRCLTQLQNFSTNRNIENPNVFNGNNCYNANKCVIYKPNNNNFGVQGSVSSSARLNRLKYATQTRNGSYFMNSKGLKQINNGMYSRTGINNNFTKINNKCNINQFRSIKNLRQNKTYKC